MPFPTTSLHRLMFGCLSLSMEETTCEINLYKLRALFHHCMLGENWTNWELLKTLTWKHIKLVKYLLHLEIIMLFQWAVLLNGKHIKRAIYMLMMRKNYGTKLFRLHKENFLSRFCCILMGMKCGVLLEGKNINSNIVLTVYLYLRMMQQVGSSGCCITRNCVICTSHLLWLVKWNVGG
jgi:hypothetical protein